jgi:hypothetical protein
MSAARRFRRIVALMVTSWAGLVFGQAHADVAALEREFARAEDLTLIHETGSLPPDVQRVLRFPIAELGQKFQARSEQPDAPSAQHLFSAASAQLYAVIYQVADFRHSVQLVLGYRGTDWYCNYSLPGMSLLSLQLAKVQGLFSDAHRRSLVCQRRDILGNGR